MSRRPNTRRNSRAPLISGAGVAPLPLAKGPPFIDRTRRVRAPAAPACPARNASDSTLTGRKVVPLGPGIADVTLKKEPAGALRRRTAQRTGSGKGL